MIYDDEITTPVLLTCATGHHWLVAGCYTPATRWEPENFDFDDIPCPVCRKDGDTPPEGYVPVVEGLLRGVSVLCDGLRMAAAERCYKCGHHVDEFGAKIAGRQLCGPCAAEELERYETQEDDDE